MQAALLLMVLGMVSTSAFAGEAPSQAVPSFLSNQFAIDDALALASCTRQLDDDGTGSQCSCSASGKGASCSCTGTGQNRVCTCTDSTGSVQCKYTNNGSDCACSSVVTHISSESGTSE